MLNVSVRITYQLKKLLKIQLFFQELLISFYFPVLSIEQVNLPKQLPHRLLPHRFQPLCFV